MVSDPLEKTAEQPSEAASGFLDAVGRNEQAIDRVLDRVHVIIKDVGTRRASMNKLTSWLLFLFMVLIVLASGYLVLERRMSDGSFTFLLGVIVGSLIQFFDRLNLGGEE